MTTTSRHGGGSRRAICPLGWRALVLLAGAATMAAGAAQAQDTCVLRNSQQFRCFYNRLDGV